MAKEAAIKVQALLAFESLLMGLATRKPQMLQEFSCQERTHVRCGCICSMTPLLPLFYAAPIAVHLETSVPSQ